MNIFLEALNDADLKAVYEFEKMNRAYFARFIPDRGDDYFEQDFFREQYQSLLNEQLEGQSEFYLIKNDRGRVIGRMNVVDIKNARGFLGYRIGESEAGKGVASSALEQLLRKELSVTRMIGKTTPDNIGSQRVM
ncbi:GNAT family N-acetyltransferase [Jeotgalibacillus aurantiacus]|uniref:GNAT family N-acetyltransferase n=1 Tax=Jeotgalibacillus aurantiacus TaxID=2763266 RepID=UPI001D09B469|nr:GNAT family N-acetyltransferase [Jeotgalibacillus aurantiacus]